MTNTTHPATMLTIESAGNGGHPAVYCATKGRRLKIEKGEKGYNATFYNVLSNKKPVNVIGLSLEQADAIGWAFCYLDV